MKIRPCSWLFLPMASLDAALGKTMAKAGLMSARRAGARARVSQNCDSGPDKAQCGRFRPRRASLRCSVARQMPSARAAAETFPSLRASARWSTARSASARSAPDWTAAEQIRGRQRLPENLASGREPAAPSASRRPPDRRHRPRSARRRRVHGRKQDAGVREGQPEILGLDPPGGIDDRNRDQVDEAFSQIGAAGRDVERGGQLALVIVDRRRRAAESVLRAKKCWSR